MNNSGVADKYLRTKIFFAKITGIAVLIVSMQFSQNGFGFKDQNIAYAGWILAVAVTVAQFIFNSKVRSLNWTITVLGVMSYVYSIWTNIIGFYQYQGIPINLFSTDAILPVLASIFLDVYPETSLAWSFNASGDGDLIGNIMAVTNDPNSIFAKNQNNSQQYRNQQQNQSSQNYGNNAQSQQSQQRQQTTSLMSNLPRTNVPTNSSSSQPMGYKTENPQKQTMDSELREELMKGIEEMRNKK